MKMQTVAVLGAGAVGSYVIWGLADKPGIRLRVLAEGERAARLKANGIGINGRTYRPEVWAPEEAHGVDFLVVCLKNTVRCPAQWTASGRPWESTRWS